MKILAELMRGTAPLFEGENEGGAAGAGNETQAGGAAADTQAGGAAAETQAAGAGNDTQPAAAAAPAAPDWKDRRIAQLTARNAQLAQKVAAQPAPAPKAPLDPTADFESRVAAQAAAQADALVAARTFNEKCNAEVDKGRGEFGANEFNASVSSLLLLVDTSDASSMANYQDFLESAIETGAGAALIFELGKNPDEAEKILALPPKRRAIELARKADAVAKPAEPSNAPRPMRAIESHGGRHEAIKASDPARADTLSTADWMARRNAEVAAQPRR